MYKDTYCLGITPSSLPEKVSELCYIGAIAYFGW